MSVVPAIPDAIRRLFDRLDAEGIRYVVLRGYLPLEELAESQDIDVYIARRNRRRATGVLARAGWLPRRYQTGRYPHRFYDNFDIPGRICTMLDVVYGLHYGDRLHGLKHPERVLATAQRLDGICVPHPWVALLTFALHVTLDKAMLSEHNALRGRKLWELCSADAGGPALLERDFGSRARAFAEAFGRSAGSGEQADIDVLARQALALDCLRARPALARVHDFWVRLRRRTMRPLRVVILGLDGSGKTTLVEYARSQPNPLPATSAYLGHNFYLTSSFRWVLERLVKLEAAGKGDGLQVKLLDKLRALLWPLELYARMRKAERGRALVFYDRYPFPAYERDDRPTTIPGHVMHAYERLWTHLLPRPDLLLFLDGDPRTLWSRKREYPFEEYERARARFLRLLEVFPGERCTVATDCALEASKAAVTDALRASTALRRRLYRGVTVAAPDGR